MRSSSAGTSIAIHLAAVALMSLIGARVAHERLAPVRIVVPLVYHRPADLNGGGGMRDPMPAERGRLPPAPISRVFVPPMVTVAQPKLPVSAAVLDAPSINVDVDQYGDPLGKAGIHSGGPGGGGGFGPGCCGGVGPGQGSRYGGTEAGAAVSMSRYTTPPKLVYKVEPEYPDEARKARYEGVVVLVAEVDASGHPARIRVMRGLGLGLDERAVEAVGRWRFSPAIDSGKPVAAPVTIEVSFRLL